MVISNPRKYSADDSLHQNVIHTLPACFKRSNNNLNNNNNIFQNGMAKRIITVVSPDGQKYRDPNLRQSPTGLHDGSSKPLKRLNSNQIRLVRLVLTFDIKSTYCMSHKLARCWHDPHRLYRIQWIPCSSQVSIVKKQLIIGFFQFKDTLAIPKSG